MKRTFILLALLFLAIVSDAQEILGVVTDKKKEPIVNATVKITQGGVLKISTSTDHDGKYSVKPLDPGYYDLEVSYKGFKNEKVTGIPVPPGEKTEVNVVLRPSGNDATTLKEVTIQYKKPLIDKHKSNTVLTSKETKRSPTTSTTDLVAVSSDIYQNHQAADISADGARTSGNVYIIDGVQVQGSTAVNAAHDNASIITPQGTISRYEPDNTAVYNGLQENGFHKVKDQPLSTMSVDVDRASYSNIRRFIAHWQMPPANAVRLEEMVNYFDYNYPQPTDGKPIAIQTELTRCPWNREHPLLRIGIQAKQLSDAELPPSNLVFLVDVSGSMDVADRLPLVKDALRLLVKQLRKQDKVSIVVYAGQAGLVLAPTSGDQKKTILKAIDDLKAGGSTAGGEGILLAYKTAQRNFIQGGNNRVVLATDGDFNVGIDDDNTLEALITQKRKTGIYLTCIGVGDDNFKDARMELLANKGNGNYCYMEDVKEAEKILVKEFKGTMYTVANDVKAQIEFNPANVQSYRLVGYEDRVLANSDFKDDTKDAGDMGAGHSVTILYELIPTPANEAGEKLKYQANAEGENLTSEIATIKFRYKAPGSQNSQLISQVVTSKCSDFDGASADTRFATGVAMFGMLMHATQRTPGNGYQEVLDILARCKGKDADGSRAELNEMVAWAKWAKDNGKAN